MAERANNAREVAIALQALLQAYDAGGGSTVYNMLSLRGSFEKIIPYEDPNFHRHFSIFATEAVAKDCKANRFVYPIGGQPPDPSIPIKDTVPYIFPIHLLQNVNSSNNDGVRREERIGQERNEGLQQNNISAEQQGFAEGNEGEEGRRREEGRMVGSSTERRRDKRIFEEMDRSSSEDSIQHISSSSGIPHVFSFIKNAREDEKALPEEARKISSLVMEYRNHDLNKAVLDFCWKAGKHHDFPDALVRDLLQYKFIDLERINAGPSACKFDIYAKSKDSDPASKIKPKPFKEATEWRDAVTLLLGTLSITFVCAKESFEKYDKHLREMERTFRQEGSWRSVIRYDIKLREAFATRRHLSFGDFASDELSHLKHLALAAKDENKQDVYSHSVIPKSFNSSYTPKASTSHHTADKKPKLDSPWAGKVKFTKNLPFNQQICGGWNLNKCTRGDKCVRIHDMCDYVGCYENHKRITHTN
ncbi:hypothetical protein DFH28DRAFT_880553 [Melampsora americana]|nr:hypothetical protein DFH28DRAFT_880553 [Melampsora americana]